MDGINPKCPHHWIWNVHVSVHSVQCQCMHARAHTHTHTHIVIPSEDHKLTGLKLKVNINCHFVIPKIKDKAGRGSTSQLFNYYLLLKVNYGLMNLDIYICTIKYESFSLTPTNTHTHTHTPQMHACTHTHKHTHTHTHNQLSKQQPQR